MQEIVTDVIFGVNVEFILTFFEQVDEGFDLIVFNGHEENVFALICDVLHVGSKVFE